MSDAAALLRAVADAPADDLARLVYADWLDEHGDPDRAAFIRLQCEPAGRGDRAAEADRLLERHRPAWEKPLRELGATDVRFRRGFPDGITISGADFVAHADALFAAAPTLRRLKITCRHGEPGNHFVLRPGCHLARYETEEELRGYLLLTTGYRPTTGPRQPFEGYLPELCDPGALRRGVELVGPDAIRLALSCPQMLRVEELDLGGNEIGPDGAVPLARSPYVANLVRLNVDGGRFDPGGDAMRAIGGAYHLDRLRVLEARDCGVTARSAAAFAGSARLPRLEVLDLRDNVIRWHPGLREFARPRAMPELRTLLLEGNPIGPAVRREIERVVADRGARGPGR